MDPQVGHSLGGHSFSLCFILCLCNSSHGCNTRCSDYDFLPPTPSMGILLPLLRRIDISTLWSSFFLSFMCFANCILGVLSLCANIHLSVSAYHVCSFVIGLPHSGLYAPDPSHNQPPNPDVMVDVNKCLLTGAWYGCLLRGSVSAWLIQKWMLTAIHWTEHRILNEGARENAQEAKGFVAP